MQCDSESSTASRAPVILPADTAPSWSGKSAAEITDLEVREICAFAEDNGWSRGNARDGSEESNPFAEGFLGGAPRLLWSASYRKGRSEEARTCRLIVVPSLSLGEGEQV